ncbi:hypothetical protein ACHAWO_011344 [Cyclotella atomus]|uniref:J domain-containing protein n=1 Tax=Cyclotella atomus TaxID=382360 RepID=A0ABD3Q8U9_9STRA
MMNTHYEVLEIKSDAELIDIKKAYRRLALKHHPDRNGGSAESTERFKKISDAYNVLSDPTSRRDYDLSLKFPSSPSAAASTPTAAARRHRSKDPFKQFDDLFRHDPFFNNAFNDMDDVFSKRFDNSTDDLRDDADSKEKEEQRQGPLLGAFKCGAKEPEKKTSWGEWIMEKLGIEVTVTSYSHEKDGSVLATNYTSKPGTSTSKKTRTYMEKGKQVTIMSMEKNGNKIEDKFIGGVLIERKVNGVVEPTAQISS